jgi:hypothetical protein
MTVRISHRQTFDVCAETYWRELCLNLAYQERLYCEALGFQSMQILECAGGYERGMKRRLRLIMSLEAPAPVLALFGRVVVMEEQSEFDSIAQRWSYRMVPEGLTDRIEVRGSVRLAGCASRVEHVGETSLTCRLFGLGSAIEPFMARSTEQGHADRVAFTQRYIVENRLC